MEFLLSDKNWSRDIISILHFGHFSSKELMNKMNSTYWPWIQTLSQMTQEEGVPIKTKYVQKSTFLFLHTLHKSFGKQCHIYFFKGTIRKCLVYWLPHVQNHSELNTSDKAENGISCTPLNLIKSNKRPWRHVLRMKKWCLKHSLVGKKMSTLCFVQMTFTLYVQFT